MAGCFTNLDLSPNPIELARQQQGTTNGYIDLTSSNPTHQGLLFPHDILQRASKTYWATRRYTPDPRGNEKARVSIANYYQSRMLSLTSDDRTPNTASTTRIHPSNIFITASTSEAYSLLFALLTDPGDNVLAPDVTYPLFDYLAEIHRITLRPYHMDEAQGWRIDEESVLAQVDNRTRAVLLISPHNPTGAVVQHPLVCLDRLGLPVICDEVFAAFPYSVSHVPLLTTLHPHLPVFHLNGISKMFALPDMKLGWIALNDVAHAAYGERLELLNDTFLGANMLSQTMLPTLFAEGQDFIEQMATHIRTNLDSAVAYCADCPTLQLSPPDGGYYLFPSVSGWDDEEELVLFLLEQGILVHPGFFYGDVDGTHIMLSALTEHEQFMQGLEMLVKVLGIRG